VSLPVRASAFGTPVSGIAQAWSALTISTCSSWLASDAVTGGRERGTAAPVVGL
jgi:hypothetical protein